MAVPQVPDSIESLRRFRAANKGAGAKVRPAWTVGDDSDDEDGSMMLQSARKRKTLRRREVKRQLDYDDGEFGGFRPPPEFPRPPPPPPESITATEASGGIPVPTSLLDSITASLGEATDSTTSFVCFSPTFISRTH